MAPTTISPPNDFALKVSSDSLCVTLSVEAGAECSAAAVIAALRDLKLASFDDGCVIEALDERAYGQCSAVVATGTAPIDEKPARIEFRVPTAGDANCPISRVEVGQVVATLTPAIPGVDGRDVFGCVIPHQKDDSVQVGRGLSLANNAIVTTSRGNFRLNGKLISVEPLLELQDGDDSIAPINFDGDVFSKGTLCAGRVVQVGGTLTVNGAIQAIQLKTGGTVNVKGGIVGEQKGKFIVGADVRCRFVSGGLLIVAGDLFVQSEIMDSRVTCIGRVHVAHGAIYGGLVAANGGISCDILGNASGAPTVIAVGEGIASKSFIASKKMQIEANNKRVADVRAKIEPLLQQLKNLSPVQKEKATELLYEAGQLEAQTQKMAASLQDQLKLYREKAVAEIEVKEAAMPGVKIKFFGLETTLNAVLKGPFTLQTRQTGSIREIVMINGVNQSVTVLPSQAVPTDEHIEDAPALKYKAV